MNRKILLTTAMLSVVFFGAIGSSSIAFAVYLGNVGDAGETGAYTLEEALAVQRARVIAAAENPASGSGTPYLDADGIVGATIIAGAVFGGVAGAFLVRGRSGRYAAMGRG